MSTEKQHSDVSTPIMGTLFIIFAAVTFWDTTSYTDPDSYVFPRAIALVMVGLSILLIIRWLFVAKGEPADFSGSTLRRIGFVLAMLASTLLMPWLGFVVSGVIVFLTIILLAMYDSWTPLRIVIYPSVGIAIVLGFYFLFKELLSVPLPVGSVFGA